MAVLRRLLPVLLPGSAGVVSTVVSWNRWITPFVDSSREMQVPARLAAGELLYRDVVYCYGPVGPWAGALLLKTFGNRWSVLEAMCGAISILLFVALFRLARVAGSRLSATAATTVAAALCVGAPLGGSFLFPYSIDFLFGLAFGLAALALSLNAESRSAELLAAGCLALSLGSRIELGASAGAIMALSSWRWSGGVGGARRGVRIAIWGLLGGIVVYGIAFAGISLRDLSPEGPGLLLSPPPEWRAVYRVVAGLDAPGEGIRRVATSLLLVVVVVGASWVLRGRPGRLAWMALVLACVVFVSTPEGSAFDSSLPSLLACAPLLAFILAAWVLLRGSPGPAWRARFLLFAFSAVVGSRVLLRLTYVRQSTPFSIMAIPLASALLAVILIDLIDLTEWAPGKAPGESGFRRNVTVAFAGIALAGLLRLARLHAPARSVLVSTSVGDLRLPPLQAGPTSMTFRYLEREARPGDTLVGFPEAGIFNFALGLRNPLREEQNLPGNLTPADEKRVVERLLRARPRFVLLVNQPSFAFGPSSFGEDYDRSLWAAIRGNYSIVASFGTRDLSARVGSQPFFIRVYERISRAP